MSTTQPTSKCDVLIIGNGFAGRCVASALNRHTMIVERGERISVSTLRQRYNETAKTRPRHDIINELYESRLSFNARRRFSDDFYSRYVLVDGGSSNYWDGNCFRLESSVFDEPTSGHEWPFSYSDVVPYYEKAEQLLRVSTDPKDPERQHQLPRIHGGDSWRKSLRLFFPGAYLSGQAHNLDTTTSGDQGNCSGAGDCQLCPVDAKTRSFHIEVHHPVINEVLVTSLVFEGDRAVRALCRSESGQHEIMFNDVVLAAHGIESPRVLWNSALPEQVRAELLGRFYQDHALAQLAGEIPGTMLPHLTSDTRADLVIPELCGSLHGVNFLTVASLRPPPFEALAMSLDLGLVNSMALEKAMSQLGSTCHFGVLLEVPPQWNVTLCHSPDGLRLDTRGYHQNKGIYDDVISEIYGRMRSRGVRPILGAEKPHYRHIFGTHHLMGTLNMSKGGNGVVDDEFRLRGTRNVYVAGSSLFPRCGSRNPTLTIVALSMMLSEKLDGNGA